MTRNYSFYRLFKVPYFSVRSSRYRASLILNLQCTEGAGVGVLNLDGLMEKYGTMNSLLFLWPKAHVPWDLFSMETNLH